MYRVVGVSYYIYIYMYIILPPKKVRKNTMSKRPFPLPPADRFRRARAPRKTSRFRSYFRVQRIVGFYCYYYPHPTPRSTGSAHSGCTLFFRPESYASPWQQVCAASAEPPQMHGIHNARHEGGGKTKGRSSTTGGWRGRSDREM